MTWMHRGVALFFSVRTRRHNEVSRQRSRADDVAKRGDLVVSSGATRKEKTRRKTLNIASGRARRSTARSAPNLHSYLSNTDLDAGKSYRDAAPW